MPRLGLPLVGQVPLYLGTMQEDLHVVGRGGLAEQVTGGLTSTSKMPCPSWGIPATRCKIGSVLAKMPGTTCSRCYARKGRYGFPNVQAKLEKRYQGLFHELWTPAMVFLIRWYADRYFRWFDSGDIQDENHLCNIATIAKHTSDVLHWLPTREALVVQACRDVIPENLVVRLSAAMIDGKPPRWPTTSTVVTKGATCPAPSQGGVCGDCRECWDAGVENVSYRLH